MMIRNGKNNGVNGIIAILLAIMVLNSCGFDNGPKKNSQSKDTANTVHIKSTESTLLSNIVESTDIQPSIDTAIVMLDNGKKAIIRTLRYFCEKPINLKIYTSLDKNKTGKVDSIIFSLKKKKYKVFPKSLLIIHSDVLSSLMKISDWHFIYFRDYNFDDFPDVVFYNSESGVTNKIEDIFIYDQQKDDYFFCEKLHEVGYIVINEKEKIITSIWKHGMAGMRHSSRSYKWINKEIVTIKSVEQDYNDSLDIFIREIKELVDTNWTIKVDTLNYTEAEHWE